MLHIVVPMAGRGMRFAAEGFDAPKPLIPVGSQAMIQRVIENLRPQRPHRFIFICLREHLESHDLAERLRAWAPGCTVLSIEKVTEGAACTVLLAKSFLNEEPLLIANCDQWVRSNIDDFLAVADTPGFDGCLMTMKAHDPKWSYVQFDGKGQVSSVVEKEVVSDEATVGVYHFRRGLDFVDAAQEMIEAGRRVQGEFYVAPVYNELLRRGSRLGVYNVGCVGDGMYGLGVPSDLRAFLSQMGSLGLE